MGSYREIGGHTKTAHGAAPRSSLPSLSQPFAIERNFSGIRPSILNQPRSPGDGSISSGCEALISAFPAEPGVYRRGGGGARSGDRRQYRDLFRGQLGFAQAGAVPRPGPPGAFPEYVPPGVRPRGITSKISALDRPNG